jgi:hypothetical protein
MTGKQRLHVRGAHGDPFPVDWDGDGDLDLLSGSSEGGVQWAENTAGRGRKHALEAFERLIGPGRKFDTGEWISEAELTEPSSSRKSGWMT